MSDYRNLISTVRELSKSERIIFEKTHGQNLSNINKDAIKKYSELYELLNTLSEKEILAIYNLAFPNNLCTDKDISFYIDSLFNCFDLASLLPEQSLTI